MTAGIRFAHPIICSSQIVCSWVCTPVIDLRMIAPISAIWPPKNGTSTSTPLSNTEIKMKYDTKIPQALLLPSFLVNRRIIFSTAIDSTYPVKIRYTRSSEENSKYQIYTTTAPANQKINDIHHTWFLSWISWCSVGVVTASSSSSIVGLRLILLQRSLALEMISSRFVGWVFMG